MKNVFLILIIFSCSRVLLAGNFLFSSSGRYKTVEKVVEGAAREIRVFDVADKKYLSLKVIDVTGYGWIENRDRDFLIYSVSSIYGKPGLYIFDPEKNKNKIILKPKNYSKAYPDGTDFFKFIRYGQGKIFYNYAPNVDAKDFGEAMKEIHQMTFAPLK